MFTLTSLTSCSSAIRSSTGATAWHGPHHSAQKSTRTLPSLPVTSCSNVASVASVAMGSFLGVAECPTRGGERLFPSLQSKTVFSPLPSVPDNNALELEILELWERERTFERVRDRNRGGPKFSFMDGPITANNPAGVHHGHGR